MPTVNMAKNAYVRMRGMEWDLAPETAAHLERSGMIWRDYDCEQNTNDNGFLDEGPCYGVMGEEDSPEEQRNAAMLDELAITITEELPDA